ncbi:MAG: hypothetical protein IIB83_06370 [Bacteroidetes bacterium]|nr:hypothetical protein [Bacteroidota bacterium]
MKKQVLLIILFPVLLFVFGCENQKLERQPINNSLITTAHLDSLYEEITVTDQTNNQTPFRQTPSTRRVGIIHIYSEYPDYKWVGDADEGIACVDDAARAAVFYLKYSESYADESSKIKAKKLIEFIMYMQADNGFFYNFIFDDYSINRDHKNSINEPNWWSWRAMWALSEGYLHFVNVDKDFADIIYERLEKVTEELKKIINVERETKIINGKDKITWLPIKSGSDQASIIILSLLNYYEINKDESILEYVNNLSDGILNVQKGDSTSFPYYAIMSWENLWHAYGNLQSYSLLKASSVLEREDILQVAISEINYFYKFLMSENYLSSFYINKRNDEYVSIETKQYSQIAYNYRVMVYACIEAYNITKDSSYASMAGEIASWFFGNNIAEAQMYFPLSGICYDGINSQNTINKNSGAESTIEALLTLLTLEQNQIAINTLTKILEGGEIISNYEEKIKSIR